MKEGRIKEKLLVAVWSDRVCDRLCRVTWRDSCHYVNHHQATSVLPETNPDMCVVGLGEQGVVFHKPKYCLLCVLAP